MTRKQAYAVLPVNQWNVTLH